MQQGRVQLDADQNERDALAERTLRTALTDLFGPNAAPARAAGFGLRRRMGLEFTGTQRLLLAEVFDRGRHTLELWLSWHGRPGVLADCRDAFHGRTGYTIEIEDDGTLVLTLEGEALAARRTLRSSQRLQVKIPSHLALVIGDDFAALYLDSRQVVRDTYRGVHLEAPAIMLGGPLGDASAARGFVGLLCGARVWRAVRTLPQIAATSLSGPQVEEDPDLHAMLAFDEGSGALLQDAVSGRTVRVHGETVPGWQLLDLLIEPGRLYVDGVACELKEHQLFSRQAPATNASLPTSGLHMVYLEAWEETVSAVQDPALREVALGGLDTSVATRIATRVRIAPMYALPDPDDDAALASAIAESAPATTGRLAAEHAGDHAPGNSLYRVEIHEGGRLHAGEREVVDIELGDRELVVEAREEWRTSSPTF
jgi:hypothetical protein